MEFHQIKSERIILRTLNEDDIDDFFEYRSDENIARYQYWEPFNYEQATNYIQQYKESTPGIKGKWFQLGIEEIASCRLIGDLAVFLEESESGNAEIGFSLASFSQHKGLAFESLNCFISYIFNILNAHRVTATVDCDNVACIRLLERLSMRCEGHFIDNVWFKGRWGSEYIYAILADEWRECIMKKD